MSRIKELNGQLREAIAGVLPDVEMVIGWGRSVDPATGRPQEGLESTLLFMRSAEDVQRFTADPLAVGNPALFLPELKGRKVGVVVKGCDSRSVGQLLAEKLVNREDLTVIGFPCRGVIDRSKVASALAERTGGAVELGVVTLAEFTDDELTLPCPKGNKANDLYLPLQSVLADKCLRCEYPNAVFSDVFTGEKIIPATKDGYADLAAFEAMNLAERMAFWERQMEKCTRCYACRNACPLCVCRDHCLAESRDPTWVSQADGVREKLFFQIIHATHLAGRCTGCGECERACPVGIPLLLLKRSLSRAVENLFFYKAGLDPEATPPLMTFDIEEKRIKEREWK